MTLITAASFNKSKAPMQKPSFLKFNSAIKPLMLCLVVATSALVTGCQTTRITPVNEGVLTTPNEPARLQSFNIRGKIGITTPATDTQPAQSGSAFYAWVQEDDRFAMDITGAIGIGHTVIEYDGVTATLVSDRTGEISADNVDDLLTKATGWQTPISQFSYWISGRPTPSDNDSTFDELGRLQTANNGEWTASFSYSSDTDTLPSKIKVTRSDGHKVIMTINHVQP